VERGHVCRAGAVYRADLETVTDGRLAFDLDADATGQINALTLVLVQYALADNRAIHFDVVLGFRSKANGVMGLGTGQRGVAIRRTDYSRARIGIGLGEIGGRAGIGALENGAAMIGRIHLTSLLNLNIAAVGVARVAEGIA